jgi:HEAT repeat protein
VWRLFRRLRGDKPGFWVPDDARFEVAAWLKNSSTPQVIEQLLGSPNSTVRWSCAFVLRSRRDPVAIDPLWQTLLHDRSRLVRQQSAVALGKIGTLTVQGPLTEGLWHDPDAGVRQACAIALGNLRNPAAADDIVGALHRELDVFVRWDCILALGRVGDLSLEPLLADLAASERTEAVRRACAEALAEIRQRQ